jgi:nucleotide-binding universal stress UspA family protein
MTRIRAELAGPSARSISGAPIVLGTDFRAASAGAERAAIRTAVAQRVDLVIVHAIDPRLLRLADGRWRVRVDEVRAHRERDAAALVAVANAAGVSARVLIWNGDPADCVADAARAEGARLIIVGTNRCNAASRALAGTVSAQVIQQADCPVAIVGRDADVATGPVSGGRTAPEDGPFDT